MREMPWGTVLARIYTAGVVGDKDIVPKPRNLDDMGNPHPSWAEIIASWLAWSRNPATCDFTREDDLKTMLAIAIQHLLADGEAFFRIRPGDPLAIEMIDPGRVPTYDYANVNRRSILGVEHDKFGRRIGYLVWAAPLDQGQGTVYYKDKLERVAAGRMLHFRLPSRIHAIRGIPVVWAVAAMGENINSFEILATKNAQINAQRIGVVKSTANEAGWQGDRVPWDGTEPAPDADAVPEPEPAPAPDPNAEPEDVEVGEYVDDLGMHITYLPDGTEMDIQDSKYPMDVDAFIRPLVQQMSASLGVSAHNLSGDTKNVNFAAGKLGLQGQDQNLKNVHEALSKKVLHPIWRKFVARNIQNGTWQGVTEMDFDALVDVHWMTPKPLVSDIKAQAMAEKLELENGTTSSKELVEAKGGDFEKLAKERTDEGRTFVDHKPQEASIDPDALAEAVAETNS